MSDQFDAKAFLKTVTSQPGVYRMYDAGGTVIYVGKAKDLKKRLSSVMQDGKIVVNEQIYNLLSDPKKMEVLLNSGIVGRLLKEFGRQKGQ